MSRLVSIYALVDPVTEEVRYIGQSLCPGARHYQHINGLPGDRPEKREWIDGLLMDGKEPSLRILEVVPQAEADERERQILKEHLAAGARLTNGLTHTRNPLRSQGTGRQSFRVWLTRDGFRRLRQLKQRWDIRETEVIEKALELAARDAGLE